MTNFTPKFYLCIAVLMSIVQMSFSQTLSKHITEQDGLSYRWVLDITQDSKGFIWLATYNGLDRYDGIDFLRFNHFDSDTTSISSSQVYHIAEDAQGNIWTYGNDLVFNRLDVATGTSQRVDGFWKDGGLVDNLPHNLRQFSTLANEEFVALFQYRDLSKCAFWRYSSERNMMEHVIDIPTDSGVINYFSQGSSNTLWLWGMGVGYYQVDLEDQTLEHFPVASAGFQDYTGVVLPVDAQNRLWFPSKGELESYSLPEYFECDKVAYVLNDNHQGIWMTYGADTLYRLNTNTRTLEFFVNEDFGEIINTRSMPRVFVDQEEAFWIGHFYGALRFANRDTVFNTYARSRVQSRDSIIDNFSARQILQLDSVTLLVRENRNDFFKVDLLSGSTELFDRSPINSRVPKVKTGTHSWFIGKDGFLWSGQGNALVRTNILSGAYDVFPGAGYSTTSFAMTAEDNEGKIWWCSNQGVFQFDKEDELMSEVKMEHDLQGVQFRFSSFDHEANAIYATWPGGVLIIDCSAETSSQLQIFGPQERDYNVTAVLKWDNVFWLSTDRGLIRFDPMSNERTLLDRSDGLPSDLVYSALGHEKHLWLASHNGLCQLDPSTLQMQVFHTEDGLPNNEFNKWSYLKGEDGQLFFGGLSGIVGFDPEEFEVESGTDGVLSVISAKRYNTRKERVYDIDVNSYTQIEPIVLSPYERTVEFEYVLPTYSDVERVQYYHRMSGLEGDWVQNGTRRDARYIQLPSGNYTFEVKAIGSNSKWTSNRISIPVVVKQYWYLRWWAILSYILLGISVIWYFYKRQLSRRMVMEEAKRRKELDEVKTRMYANITHELRTPLTVILGMNSAARNYAMEGDFDSMDHASEMIERNGKGLVGLVNQMLDLSKLESGMLELRNEQADFVAFLRYHLESYQSYASEKQIDIVFRASEEKLIMDFDAEKASHMVSNLVSNAIKFTPGGGRIDVELHLLEHPSSQTQGKVSLRVRDTGVGIKKEDLLNIFDRFYSVGSDMVRKGEGTGIGLSLVKEVVSIMQGSIDVRSEEGVGTEFEVQLPITNQAPAAKAGESDFGLDLILTGVDTSKSQPGATPIKDHLPMVLVAEDNSDVRHYISLCIDEDYRVVTAQDGQQGIEKAQELIPDIVISDVMMPKMTGYELCRVLKQDHRTSHIPVILLTAKADQDSKIVGLEQGADAYLSKPFDKQELQIRIKNLLSIRNELHKRYSHTDFGSTLESPVTIEDEFLMKTRLVILDHVGDEDFSVNALAKELHLSRAQLHRKLVALTGQPTTSILRTVRLERACELLKEQNSLSVSEVAFRVGFKTQAHFSRVFAETFGMSPSNFKKSGR